ncbi:response regulator [Mucilaginibacter sp. 10I4]|uniref:ATP-binding response regulator n=1 Tax=Mucilaginibacter sp. 10I4 TaxID=3048580 RepID=UPI002B22F35F|nr:response regulator [Mucilaginibacter sp. 10I4]MEB0264042.1 response regulator [Mucilaginibacter sp. 10I4]
MSKILLIEDERILRENTSELLEAYGYNCIVAQNGKTGLQLALQESPDLIISDIMLPYLDGYAIKAELNKSKKHAQIPFVFLSAKIERNDLRKGMDLGAADYLTKPFKISELINSVETRLSNKKIIEAEVETKIIESIANFIHIAKHECNTPLNGIINLSEILGTQIYHDANFFKSSIQAIKTSGKRLHKTLNNLIDIVRLRHYPLNNDFNKSIVEVNDVLVSIIKERSDFYEFEKEVEIHAEEICNTTLPYEDLVIVIFELVDNAFKFCTKDDAAKVIINLQNSIGTDYFKLNISNPTIYPPFFTIAEIGPFMQKKNIQIEQQGSGLGLYLVKHIADKYHSNLTIEYLHNHKFNISFDLFVNNETTNLL